MAKFYGVQTGSIEASPSMIRVMRVCRKCGAKIFSDVAEGLCPRCVLKSALGNFPDAVAGVDLSAVPSAKADDPGRVDEPLRDEANAAAAHTKKTSSAAEFLGYL